MSYLNGISDAVVQEWLGPWNYLELLVPVKDVLHFLQQIKGTLKSFQSKCHIPHLRWTSHPRERSQAHLATATNLKCSPG
jgi:hypothetical protein